MDFQMNVTPWAHQREDFDASRNMPAAALPWEPRCGKTKIAIDTAAWLYARGEIDAAIVVAPNGVHLNWTRVEIPAHWPAAWPAPRVVEWESGRTTSKKYMSDIDQATDHNGFLWVAVNMEALGASTKLVNRSKKGDPGYLDRLVKKRRCILIVDEVHGAKNPKAKRTKAIHKIASQCPYRRTLTGTPVSQGPFDLWSQYYILDPKILGERFVPFRNRYGIFKRVRYGNGPLHDELVDYKNLDELNARIAPYTFPRRKADCFDLPERVFAREHFILDPEQRRVYNELRDELVARLDSGEEISAAHALTNLLRLQQVSRGHVTREDGTTAQIGEPRALHALKRIIDEHDGKAIIWCRFVSDVGLITEAFTQSGIGTIRCDGSVPSEQRPALIQQFRDSDEVQVWCGTLATGGVGVDLAAANLMVFYSHGFSLVDRAQGLERNFGSRQQADRCDVVDLVAADTVDARALDALAKKEDLASRLTGAKLREILT